MGNLTGLYAEAADSPIHAADFAAIVVATLRGAQPAGRTYHVTGPRSLTHREQIALIGAAHGRNLRFEELDPAAARAAISPAHDRPGAPNK
jgi:uncharacterized protein YbjT (DUF2867 family)